MQPLVLGLFLWGFGVFFVLPLSVLAVFLAGSVASQDGKSG